MSSATPPGHGVIPPKKLTSETPGADELFGKSVGISGSRMVVGAPGYPAGGNAGMAYWIQAPRLDDLSPVWRQGEMLAPLARAGDQHGFSVAISSGARLVGAPGPEAAPFDAGAAHVFSSSGTARLNPRASSTGQFGYSVAVSGGTAAIGARMAKDAQGYNTGAVYIH